MVQNNSITWNENYENDGILYFIQRIIELLDYNTIDIFRAPLLNTTRLINEYKRISNENVKQYHLNEVLNELKTSIENDVILQYKFSEEQVGQLLKKLNASNDKKAVVEYLSRIINPYYLDWCVDYLKYIVPQNKHKEKIERAIKCYIPELFSCGYNREDIFFSYRDIFTNLSNPQEMFETLLKMYNNTSEEYSVYLSLSNELIDFRDVLENNLKCSLVDDGNFKKLSTWANYFIIKLPNIKSKCMTMAVETSLEIISTFLRFYQFFGNYSNKLIQNSALVISGQGKERIIYTNKDKYNSIEDKDHPRTGKLSTLVIEKLFRNSKKSIPELKKILKLHNTAISNNGLENGFLNFWSILEITCVNDPDGSKIEQVISKLVPILKLKYWCSVFEDISANLKQVSPEGIWLDLLNKVEDGTTSGEKIAYLTLYPKYSDLLDEYTDHLQNYPVLRSRLLNIHDNYSDNRRNMLHFTDKYAQRVSWHLYRIYRARNAITHNGKCPIELKDLGEHLHAYVDYLIEEILIKMCMGSLNEISNVFVDSDLYLDSIKSYLNSDTPFDNNGIALLVSSQFFCWCNNKTVTTIKTEK
ncbi:MAG: hypothetical protein E7564_00005 [Ruminococcaceae bacterium]|nr:hypothetical protein [Oscillospiraceae bacterium]